MQFTGPIHMSITSSKKFTCTPCWAKQRHARERKCYPSVCPKQPSVHQPTGLWSGRPFGAFWQVPFDTMKWHNFPFNFWLGLILRCHRNTITDTCASSLKPAASPRTSSGRITRIDIFISSIICGCLYLLHGDLTIVFHGFPGGHLAIHLPFFKHQGATLLRLLNSTSGFPFRSLSMLHNAPRGRQSSIVGQSGPSGLNLCKVPKVIKAVKLKDTKWQL